MSSSPQKILIAGASGLIGSAAVRFLRETNCEVLRLVRHAPQASDEIAWNPSRGELDPAQLEGIDAVVNLAGENVGAGRWTEARREKILRSRVDATRTLVAAFEKMTRRPQVFLTASATGFYGDRGDEALTEASEVGRGFLPGVCLAWETHAESAVRLGIRTVRLRFGIVLSGEGGALAKMLPLFRMGLGGRLGRGEQWMSWIALDDVTGVIQHVLGDIRCAGAVNVVAPEPVRNREFTTILGRTLKRPAVLAVPATILRVLLGQMAEETVLISTKAVPAKLTTSGYSFRYPKLSAALDRALRR
jgi:uncharacterized protein (TIGR01777 family)